MMSNIPRATFHFAWKASPSKSRSRSLTNARSAALPVANFRDAESLRHFPSLMRDAACSSSCLVRICGHGKRTDHRERRGATWTVQCGFASARRSRARLAPRHTRRPTCDLHVILIYRPIPCCMLTKKTEPKDDVSTSSS